MGFAVATHYCGGLAVESQIVMGNAVLDCGMANMDQQPCESMPSQKPEIRKKPCCQNEYQSLDVEDDFKQTIVQSTVNVEFVAAFIVSFLQVSLASENEAPQFANYSPPLIDQDISVLHQVFLI